jgi:hypothetical protein
MLPAGTVEFSYTTHGGSTLTRDKIQAMALESWREFCADASIEELPWNTSITAYEDDIGAMTAHVKIRWDRDTTPS